MTQTKNDSIDLYYYGQLVWGGRRLIFQVVFIVTLISIILALSLPKKFTSTAILLPPGSDGNCSLVGMLSNLPFGGMLGGSSDETNSIIAILKSRTLLDAIVREFNLVEYYGVDFVAEGRILLSEDMGVSELEEGTIAVAFNAQTDWFHPDVQEKNAIDMSFDLATFCISELDRINKQLKTEQATFNRAFIEQRYYENLSDLRGAEDSLRDFQELYGVIALDEQVAGSINAAVKIQETIIMKEIELRVGQASLTPDHPTVIKLSREIKELNKSLSELKKASAAATSDQLLLPLSQIPELGMQWLRLKRKVEVQNQIFIFLTQQYEEAKIKEAKDTPTVQLLDEPIRAELKTSPKRTRLVLIAFFLSMMSSIIYILLIQNGNIPVEDPKSKQE